ncbi:MAG: hypothetical protein Q4Q00_03860 [Turicibacter sp.]|nr:hypothetical protein [Turicibacter sp.]
MLNVITNIILSVIFTLSSNASVTLEKNQITPQSYVNLLNAIVENETQNSFLDKESNGELTSIPVQESQELTKVSSVAQSEAVQTMIDNNSLSIEESEKKVTALKNLQAALSQDNEIEDVENQAFMLKQPSDEMVKATPLSTNHSTASTEVTHVMSETEEETEEVFKNYRQTFYSVTAGEVKVGYGLTYQDDGVKVIDNVMHYYDDEYDWLPIVAVNIDEVLEVGLNERGIPNYYGTILEITYPEGETQKAIVLDACGACSWDNRIDLWVYDHDYQHDIKGIEYRIIREGFREDEEQSGY